MQIFAQTNLKENLYKITQNIHVYIIANRVSLIKDVLLNAIKQIEFKFCLIKMVARKTVNANALQLIAIEFVQGMHSRLIITVLVVKNVNVSVPKLIVINFVVEKAWV